MAGSSDWQSNCTLLFEHSSTLNKRGLAGHGGVVGSGVGCLRQDSEDDVWNKETGSQRLL